MSGPDDLGRHLGSLAPIAAAGRRAAVITDFDGTLAAIVEDPGAARPVPGAREALARAASVFGTVAVVSGRPLSFLARHLGDIEGVVLVGIYGLERWVDGSPVEVPAADPWRPVVSVAADRLAAVAPDGVEVERKGLAVTVHWRRRPDQAARMAEAIAVEGERSGLVSHPGRATLELRPPIDVDKGTVVGELVAGAGAACFFGDDLGDLPAFAALDRVAQQEGIPVAKVVAADAECPPEVVALADVLVDGPAGAVRALDGMAAAAAAPAG